MSSLYVSAVIGKPVYDASGESFDSISDLVIFHGTEKFPRITGILLKGDRSRVAVIPWDAVAGFSGDGIKLRMARRHLAPRPLQPDEILLSEDVLDSQVVDTDDIKVVRGRLAARCASSAPTSARAPCCGGSVSSLSSAAPWRAWGGRFRSG